MSKDYTCPCGNLTVKFKGSKARVRGGWMKGSPPTHVRCFECRGSKRIAYSVVFLDKNNEPFHPKKETKNVGRTKRKRKPRRKQEEFVWSFE